MIVVLYTVAEYIVIHPIYISIPVLYDFQPPNLVQFHSVPVSRRSFIVLLDM